MRNGVTNILLSIKPRWAEKIYAGEKTVEVRSKVPQAYGKGLGRDVLNIVFYETSPVMRITGTAVSRGFRPMEGYGVDLTGTCLNSSEYESYAKGRTVFGIQLEDVRRFDNPLPIAVIGYRRPPMSFFILSDEQMDSIVSEGVTE